jgi:hypothetical protein
MIARQVNTKTTESSKPIYGAARAKVTKTRIKRLQYWAAKLAVVARDLNLCEVSELSDDSVRKDVYRSWGVSRACVTLLSVWDPEQRTILIDLLSWEEVQTLA